MSSINHDAALARYRPEPKVWALVAAAALRTRNSFSLAFMSLVGLIMLAGGMPLTGLGMVAGGALGYGLLVLHDLFDPELIREVHQLEAPGPRVLQPLPTDLPLDLVAAPHRELVAEIRVTYASLRRRQQQASRALPTVFDRCGELAHASGELARRGHKLFNYLAHHSIAEVTDDLVQLGELVRATDDSKARAALETATTTRRDHLGSLQQIQRMFDRVTAQLAVIHSSLQLVESRLVELDAYEADLDDLTNLDEISDLLAIELAGFEAIDELCELDAVAGP